jgi:hypothetical protein
VKSVCDGKWTEPSFTKWWNVWNAAEEYSQFMKEDWSSTVCILECDNQTFDEDLALEALREIDLDAPSYPFDTRVQDGENVYYYPSSMAGFMYRLLNSPEAYNNSVQVYVPEGGNVTVGLRKNAAIGSDWLIYDDFQLFYLGNDPSVGIANVENTNAQKSVIYNLQGQRLTAPQKGVNIINGKKVLVK